MYKFKDGDQLLFASKGMILGVFDKSECRFDGSMYRDTDGKGIIRYCEAVVIDYEEGKLIKVDLT